MSNVDYKAAGVDIHAGNESVKRIKSAVEKTFHPEVLNPLGGFGALYDLKNIINNYQNPVLVQSIDGVGTKTIIAKMMNRYDTIGRDLVSATANDIIVLGAKPITFLDYIANEKLNPHTVEQIVQGMVDACIENDISLVGGETAEMPGTYLPGEHDLVGVITGVVEKDLAITGKNIQAGQNVYGFASSGLHTNGYSLARHLFFGINQFEIDAQFSGLNKTLGETLLEPHLNYTQPVLRLLANKMPIYGMAHITGGGLIENIPRILPKNCDVKIFKNSWPVQPIFRLMQDLGRIEEQEMYKTFNMGIGLIVIADQINDPALYKIGEVVAGKGVVQLCA